MMFVPAMLALLPRHLRWMDVIPIEGLLGRVVGDFLIHYLNLVGAYIVCATVLAVALYLSTAFSFSAIRLWAPTRFAFIIALWNRYKDWQEERRKKRQQKELEQRRISKPRGQDAAHPVASRRPAAQTVAASEPRRTGIERMMAEETAETGRAGRVRRSSGRTLCSRSFSGSVPDPEVAERGDSGNKAQDHDATHRRWRIQAALQQSAAASR